ncbi:MAG TPA: glucosamine-6-phosphate deaminase [Vicinamibacterales bacterium]|nr:glucosamine-6-phosphate deaminase [Vicinamibacterales bacterium]
MRVVTYASARRAAAAAAAIVLDHLSRNRRLVLGLPTGNTPIPMYHSLVRAYEQGRADFSQATTFNLDEFVGLGKNDPGSYRTFMNALFFDHVNMSPSRAHMPDGRATDWRREILRYDRRIARTGGLDLVVLGIGGNGHLGFNEPGTALEARTHRVALRPETRRANARLFGGRWQDVPAYALSMGIGTILTAKHVVLLATGAAKARVVARALTGPVTTQLPASLLQVHPEVVVVLDRAAAARITAFRRPDLQVRQLRRL